MMNKVLTYRSVREGGEPVVYMAEDRHMKTASSVCPDLLQALSELGEPEKDMVRTVVTALSSHEAFGPNRNGDAFFEDHLLRKNKYEQEGESFSCPMHESFKHFARPYKYHINKPHSPAYGRVLESVYNDDMRRVELIVEVDKSKAPDIVKKIENYEPVSTSMGFRCMKGGDVCSVCGNVAKSRKQYCDHLKNNMLKVRPDGQRVYAINPWGKFFDISFVDDPADATSRAVWVDQLPVSMQEKGPSEPVEKEASFFKGGALSADIAVHVFGEGAEPVHRKTASLSNKSASPNKSANPVKRVPAKIEMRPEEVELYRRAIEKMRGPKMSKKALDVLSEYGLKKAASSCATAGIDLYPSEAQYIALSSGFPKTASRLFDEGVLIDVSDVSVDKEASLSPSGVDGEILSAFAGSKDFLEKRSMHRPWLMRGLEKRAQNPYIEPSGQVGPAQARQIANKEAPEGVPAEPPGGAGDKIQSSSDSFWDRIKTYGAFLAGAKWLLGGKGAKSVASEHPELVAGLVGARGLAEGARRRREIQENNRMPMSQRRRGRLQQTGGGQLGGLMNSPMAYQMFMAQPNVGGSAPRGSSAQFDTASESQPVPNQTPAGEPVVTGGLLSRSMAQSQPATKQAQKILDQTDVLSYEKRASVQHLPITPEVASDYDASTIDADLVYRYSEA